MRVSVPSSLRVGRQPYSDDGKRITSGPSLFRPVLVLSVKHVDPDFDNPSLERPIHHFQGKDRIKISPPPYPPPQGTHLASLGARTTQDGNSENTCQPRAHPEDEP